MVLGRQAEYNEKIIVDGVLLFFVSALVTTIAIDYLGDTAARKSIGKKKRWLQGIVLLYAPFIMVIFVLPLYIASFIAPEAIVFP